MDKTHEKSFLNDVLPLKDTLFRLAWRITLDRAEAEDIVQDTLLKVWRERGKWESLRNPKAFSLAVCRNLALDRRRRATAGPIRPIETEDGDSGEAHDAQAKTDEPLLRDERMKLVREAMDRLPETQRTMMALRDFEGLSYQEIATAMKLTETQVKVYLHRARLKIKTRIEELENYGL